MHETGTGQQVAQLHERLMMMMMMMICGSNPDGFKKFFDQIQKQISGPYLRYKIFTHTHNMSNIKSDILRNLQGIP